MLYVYFKRAWWSGERAERMWVNYDWDLPFRDQDKLGHLLGGYHLARAGAGMLRAACVSSGKAAAWAAGYAALFQLQIEVWDGFQEKYGFSPPDVLANSVGTGLLLAQHAFPAARYVRPTLSYWPTPALSRRDQFAPGTAGHELRPTVDYSGQTYWLSADIEGLLPSRAKRYWPGILRASLGHSITDYVNPGDGGMVRARRKLLLSLDLDPERLPGQHPLWRAVKRELSFLRFPAPALQIYPSVKAEPWYR